jgi:DNA-binding NtrC family response regulator
VPHDDRNTESRIPVEEGERGKSPRLSLLVMSENGVVTYPLPERGEVTVGRSERCGIALVDPQLSREHARLRFGASNDIVDLGSSNGTKVGDRALEPNTPQPIAVGQVITLGSTIIMLQTATANARRRHLWSHGMFEARLEDECARSEQTGRSFAVVRLRAEPSAARTIEERLGEHLRPMDVLGMYAPGEYEVLLVEIDRPSATGLVGRLRADLAASLGGEVQLGLAFYPSDARTPEEIVARAAPPRDDTGGSPRSARKVVEGGALERLRPIVERVAAGNIPVLIVGETGVGKDLLANTIHSLSPRASRPLVCLNCAALPEQLLESELFGYERGAFTGAVQAKPGLLEAAEGGTAFLDEVGEMPLAVQAKLLRVLDQQEVMRIGALKPRRTDVRFVAATNRDLEAEVARGAFREDLYYRLNGVVISVPPLRQRVDEIAPLAWSFAAEAARALGSDHEPHIAPEAIAVLERYAWPGNVRELRNVIERAVLLSDSGIIGLTQLPLDKMGRTLPTRESERRIRMTDPVPPSRATLIADETLPPRSVPGVDERVRIVEALARCRGNQTQAAKLLGISRRTLISRIETYDLPRPRKPASSREQPPPSARDGRDDECVPTESQGRRAIAEGDDDEETTQRSIPTPTISMKPSR